MTLLTERDWGEEWRELARKRRPAPSEAHWDKRAHDFPHSAERSPYVDRFIEYLGIRDGETVFDMGCGNGALAIPLALDGHDVIAADFSEGMLSGLIAEADELGGLPIKTIHMSWDDDWDAHGITADCVDVAVASRSINTDDLEDSLARLDRVARRRCAITLPVGTSPRTDRRILTDIGLPVKRGSSFIYAFMILCEMGRLPEVRYIESCKPNIFKDADEAYASIERMVRDAAEDLGCTEDLDMYLERTKEWVRAHLITGRESAATCTSEVSVDPECVMFDFPRKVTWAYIAWNVS